MAAKCLLCGEMGMTIKKQLAQSNIAMLVIPLLTAAVLLLLGLGAALLLLRENMPSVHTVAYPSGSARMVAASTPPMVMEPACGW